MKICKICQKQYKTRGKSYCSYPELRFELNNGRTFCIECDLKLGWQLFRENNPKKETNFIVGNNYA